MHVLGVFIFFWVRIWLETVVNDGKTCVDLCGIGPLTHMNVLGSIYAGDWLGGVHICVSLNSDVVVDRIYVSPSTRMWL